MQNLSPFSARDYHDLATRLGIADQIDLVTGRTFKKCIRHKGCTKSGRGRLSFEYSEFNDVVVKFGFSDNADAATERSRNSSDESLSTMMSPLIISEQDDETSVDSPPTSFSDTQIEEGTCMIDHTFFSRFRCRLCASWLNIQNITKYTTHKLWGTVEVNCSTCGTNNVIDTVSDRETTNARYLASIDCCGLMVSKAQHFMLSNDLMPPDYHHASKLNERIEQAALATVGDSVANALKDESERTRGIGNVSGRGDFGWHNRANNNALTGNIYFSK